MVNITSTHFGTNNNSQLITYDLSSNINATNYFNDDNTYAKIEKSYTLYIDSLGMPSCSFASTPSASVQGGTQIEYNCGVPSTKKIQIVTGNINLVDINSTYKYIKSSDIADIYLPANSYIEPDNSQLQSTTFAALSTPVVVSGNYSWTPSTLLNLYFKISNVSSQTVAIQARVSNLRANNQATSQNVTVNLFCDRASFNISASLITSTKCPTFYELNDPDHLDNLGSLTFDEYTNHQSIIKNWTPLFCNNAFRTTTNSGDYYKDYSSEFGSPWTIDYSTTLAYLTDGTEDTNGYKWIVFNAGGSSETDAKDLYEDIKIENKLIRDVDNDGKVVAYIEKGGKWGNITYGVNFNSTSTWWDNSPTTLADTRGAFDDTYADLIRLQNNSGSNVYIIVGIKNNVQLNLTR